MIKPFLPLPLMLGESPMAPTAPLFFLLHPQCLGQPRTLRKGPRAHTSATWAAETKGNQEAPSGTGRMQAGPGMVRRPAWA